MAIESMPSVQLEAASPAPARRPARGVRKWLAIGTGVGIEITGKDLRVAAVRVRPGGAELVASTVMEDYAERPAAQWGAEYTAFARKAQVSRIPVNVVLPRREVTIRPVVLPGVENKDLAAAISYQIDSLHPYPDDSAAFAWSRLPGSPVVLVAITRRELIDRLSNLFNEAGLKLAGFTVSAAALYSASRILLTPPASFVAFHQGDGQMEAYGESAARPVFSGLFEESPEDVYPRAISELRLEGDAPALNFGALLPVQAPECEMAAAAAIQAACPRLSLKLNLLPEERRTQGSYLGYIPTAVLAGVAALAGALLLWQPSYHDARYLGRLNAEIRTLERQAAQLGDIQKRMQAAQDKLALLDRYRLRSKADADALKEITNLLVPPAWAQSVQMSRSDLFLTGEAEQAAGLLKLLDASPLFKDSAFSQTLTRIGGGSEQFVIRAAREGTGTGLEPGETR